MRISRRLADSSLPGGPALARSGGLYPVARLAVAALAVLCSTALVPGCNFTQTGETAPATTFNFPIAVALSTPSAAGVAADHLFVVSSNFDLRYNTGALHVLDLRRLRERLDADGCGGNAPCQFQGESLAALFSDEVAIGSHGSGVAVSPDGRRVYLPVRSERNLTFLDFDPATGRVSCDQSARDGEPIPRCAPEFRRGAQGAVASERELVLAGDPVDLVAAPLTAVGGDAADGDFVLVALRNGRVALFLDDPGQASPPELVHIAQGFPENLVSMSLQPGTGIAWLAGASSDELSRVGISLDPQNRSRSFLFSAGARRVGGIDDGEDLRHIVFDPSDPTGAFVLSRRPEAVVAVDLERRGLTSADLGLRDVFEVGQGASRMATTEINGRTYVLVSCFSAQKLFIIDADHGALVSVVGGFSGPFQLVIDDVSRHLYVVDFATSVVRVLSLAPLDVGGAPRLLATLGQPFAPSGL